MAGASRVSHLPLPEKRKFTPIECAALESFWGAMGGKEGAVAREPREVQEAKRAESQACQGGQGGQAGQGDTKSESKTRTLSQKVRQKHVPLGRKSEPRRGTNITTICVKNVFP